VQLRTRPHCGVLADKGAWAYNAGTPKRFQSAKLDANSPTGKTGRKTGISQQKPAYSTHYSCFVATVGDRLSC